MRRHDHGDILGDISSNFLRPMLYNEAPEAPEVHIFIVRQGVGNCIHEGFYCTENRCPLYARLFSNFIY